MAYEIIITNDTTESGSKAVAGDHNGDASPKKKGKEQELTKAQKFVAKGLVSWGKAKPFINQVVSHEINMVELRTGRREYAQQAQFMYQTISKVASIGESVATGFAVGNVTGAVIGLAVGVTHTLIGYSQKQQTINTENTLEGISLAQNRIRAGASGSRRT